MSNSTRCGLCDGFLPKHLDSCPNAEIAHLRARTEEQAAELIDLRDRLDRPKCFFCAFGEDVRVTAADLLQHIEVCQVHPMAALLTRLERAERVGEAAEAILKDWRRGIYPSEFLYQLADSFAAWQEARDADS